MKQYGLDSTDLITLLLDFSGFDSIIILATINFKNKRMLGTYYVVQNPCGYDRDNPFCLDIIYAVGFCT